VNLVFVFRKILSIQNVWFSSLLGLDVVEDWWYIKW
jgi:hypothetical protein